MKRILSISVSFLLAIVITFLFAFHPVLYLNPFIISQAAYSENTLPELADPQDAVPANAEILPQISETPETPPPDNPNPESNTLSDTSPSISPENTSSSVSPENTSPSASPENTAPSASPENTSPSVSPENSLPSGGPEISSPSALLMEASTGQVIYEKNADQPRSPASITKIMTLILIFDALESGKIQLTDSVTTSAYAKSMGGSQVFLEEGEVQTVETLIKCIVIASGNDASVAMAEHIAGSEGEFVRMMNERAQGLGMNNTHFEDCCGLTDSLTHVTTARDIALMSRELINHYPQIHNYSTIWMDTITHVTKQGTKEFGLSNTNKLLKMAANFTVTGLKTGSTSLAKYCFSGTAEKDGIRLIASIMAAPDYKARFNDALTLLNYGYANCRMYQDTDMPILPRMQVKNGKADTVALEYEGPFSYLSLTGEDFSAIQKDLVIQEFAEAPVTAGNQAGWLSYTLNGKKIGQVPVRFKESVEKASFLDYMKNLMNLWLMLNRNTENEGI